jgi:hypothetical protein
VAAIFLPTRTRLILTDGTIEDKTWTIPGPDPGSNWYNGYGELNAEGEGSGMLWRMKQQWLRLMGKKKVNTKAWMSL